MPWRVAGWGLASSVAAAALTWILQLAAARFLAPVTYGEALSLLAIFMLLAVPIVPVLLLVTRQAVEARIDGRPGDIRALLVGLTTRVAVGGVAVVGVVALVRHPLAALLRIADPLALPLLAAAVLANALYLIAHSVLLAERRWRSVNGLPVVLGASRLAFSLLFLALGHGVTGMFLGLAASTTVCFVIGFALAVRAVPGPGQYRPIPLRHVGLALSITVGFWFLVQLDLVYVNRYLPAVAAAGYGAASTLGRLLVYVPSTVIHLMYPYLVASRATEARGPVLRRMVAAAGGLAGMGLVVLWAVPTLLLRLAYPPEYAAAAELLPRVGTMLAPFALVNVCVYVALADHDRHVAALVVGIATLAGTVLVLAPPALETLFLVLAGAATAIVAAGTIRLWMRDAGPPPPDAHGPDVTGNI